MDIRLLEIIVVIVVAPVHGVCVLLILEGFLKPFSICWELFFKMRYVGTLNQTTMSIFLSGDECWYIREQLQFVD